MVSNPIPAPFIAKEPSTAPQVSSRKKEFPPPGMVMGNRIE
jgi:hypothetical protein